MASTIPGTVSGATAKKSEKRAGQRRLRMVNIVTASARITAVVAPMAPSAMERVSASWPDGILSTIWK